MNITAPERNDWLQWVRVTSIPLIHLGEDDSVIGLGSGMMLEITRDAGSSLRLNTL
jgi:hypothetical protein